MWTCASDGQFTTALRAVQRTGSCLSLVLFVAMNGAGEGIAFYVSFRYASKNLELKDSEVKHQSVSTGLSRGQMLHFLVSF